MLLPTLTYVSKEIGKLWCDNNRWVPKNQNEISSANRETIKAAIKFATIQSKGFECLKKITKKEFKPQLTSFQLSNLVDQVLNWLKLPFLLLDTSEIEISNKTEFSTVCNDCTVIRLVLFNMLFSALKDQNRDSKVQLSILSRKEKKTGKTDKGETQSQKVESSKALLSEELKY